MKKKRLVQKQMKRRGKRILIIGFFFLMTLGTLATIVSALQRNVTADIAQKIDLDQTAFSPVQGKANSGRGNIYDRNLNELATNSSTAAVYVRPLKLRDPDSAAKSLAPILDREADEIAARLKAETGFILLAREVAPPVAARIAALNMDGVSLTEETKRLYPNGKTGAHVIGFANSEQGLDGIEYYYDTLLHADIDPASAAARNTAGPAGPIDGIGDQGTHLVLTLDLRVQELLERSLAAVIKRSAAASGSAALISPQSGALIALANQPTFDPNRFWNFSNKDLCNRFLNEVIAPGGLDSFFKQAAEFEQIKALVRKIATSTQTAHRQPNSLLLVPTREKREVADQNAVIDQEILADLFGRLHSRSTVAIDLPSLIQDDSETGSDQAAGTADTATALQLLVDFCFMVSGGRQVHPHLLYTLWDRASDRMLPRPDTTRTISEQPVVPEETLLRVLARLGKKGPAGGFFLESVMPRHGNTSLLESLASPTDAPTEADRVNYQMLGLLNRNGQSLALIMTVNNADVTMLLNTAGKESLPIAVLDRHLDQRAIQWALTPAASLTPAMLHSSQRLLPAKMKKSRGLATATEAAVGPGNEMPLVTGLSLRCGLQALQQYDLRISVVGSGRIVAQKPQAGSGVRKGDSCMLKLASNR